MCSGSHNVYFIISKKRGLYKTYVGYAKNIKKRIEAHNSNKGAKSTRGRNWQLLYKRKFKNKKLALKYEYILKKHKKLRKKLKDKYIQKYG